MKKYNYEKLYKKYQKKNLVNVLQKKGYPLIPLSAHDTIAQVGYGCNQKRIWCADYNLTPRVGLARDKKVTNDFLNNLGIPAPVSYNVKTKKKFETLLDKLEFPLVMKPAKDTHGGKGVYVNILTKDEARRAFAEIKKISKKVLVEHFYTGDDHRVLVINYKVVAVLKRVPAHVTGDGKNTVKSLIDKENTRRKKLPLEKTASCRQIPIDTTTDETLTKQELTLESIPPKDQVVKLRFNSNVGTGGTTFGLTDEIHPQTKERCERAARLMGLRIAGVDVLSQDISKPMEKIDSVIIEVNTRPGIVMHQFPYEGKPVDTISIFAKEILGPPEKLWIPITIDGKKCDDFSLVEKKFMEKPSRVIRYENFGSQKEITIDSPKHTVVAYLMDPLTKSVVI